MRSLLYALGATALALALHSFLRARIKSPHKPAPARQPSYDEIALRAYFIGLDRETRGETCDPLKDWTQAERQLSARTACAAGQRTGIGRHSAAVSIIDA